MRRFARRMWGILALAAMAAGLLALVLVVPVVGVTTPYSAYNPGSDGLSAFAVDLYGRSLLAPALRFDDGRATIDGASFAERGLEEHGAIVVVEPALATSPEEREWIRAFVHGGGTLVVAASTPTADSFLEPVSGTRVLRGPLLDPAYSRAPEFPVARPEGGDALLWNVSRLVLTHPAVLAPGASARILATTSPQAFHDLDRDGWPSPGEPRGPFPWLVREQVGDGEVIVLADPDLLANGMAGVADGAAFSTNLATLLEGRGRVLLDEGHRGPQGPLVLLGAGLQGVPAWLRVGLPLLAWGLGLAWILRGGRDGEARGPGLLQRLLDEPPPPPPTRGHVRAELLRRHPRWDPARVDALLDQMEARA